jgi:hypothetical protein
MVQVLVSDLRVWCDTGTRSVNHRVSRRVLRRGSEQTCELLFDIGRNGDGPLANAARTAPLRPSVGEGSKRLVVEEAAGAETGYPFPDGA